MQPNRLGITAIAPLVLGVAQCRSHTQAPTVSHGGRGPRDFAEMQTATKQPRHLTLNEFAMIPAGRFKMGSMMPPEDLGEDFPLHDVAVNKVYIAKHEVTKALWDKISFWGTSHGYTDLPSGERRAADHPVQLVSWYDVVKWCNARSEMEGITPCYYSDTKLKLIYRTGDMDLGIAMVKWDANGYRLPTEAEWEWAARGGLVGKRFPWGDTINHRDANFKNFGREAYQTGTMGYNPKFWDGHYANTSGNEFTKELYTSPVGSFAPNSYGLYDMAGNVWEWCWDWTGSCSAALQTDPRGAATGMERAIRGGSFSCCAGSCGVAGHTGAEPSVTSNEIGFRSARTAIP